MHPSYLTRATSAAKLTEMSEVGRAAPSSISRFGECDLVPFICLRGGSAMNRFIGVLVVVMMFLSNGIVRAGEILVSNLVTDDQSANAALITDPDLKNAWG